jgi:hypothetical protein
MKTRLLIIIVGIIISISIVSILMNIDQAFAFCDAHSEPCFQRIKTYDKIDDHFVRNYFFDYADDVFVHYDWPNKSDNVANNFDGFPAVYCFEIIADGEPHFLMANWIDHKSISNIVDMYVPELCEQSLNPINSENRPDSLYVNKPMKTLTPIPNALILSTPNLHPDDLQNCLLGDFDDKNYEWCNNYKEKIKLLPPLKQFKSGVPVDEIQCKENLVLIQKYDVSTACVTESTKLKLIERGWATTYPDTYDTKTVFEIVKDEKIFDVEYKIKGGSVEDMVYDKDGNTLLTTIDSSGEGKFTVVIPRDLLDVKMDYCPPLKANPPDGRFFVLLDGKEISYDEILTTSEKRTLQIPFTDDAILEIIGACLI